MRLRLPHGRYAFFASLVLAAIVGVTAVGRVDQTGAAEGEADSEPITAVATISEVVDTVVVRATYVVGELELVPAPELDGADPVVIHLGVARGDQIDEGQLIAVVAGRPLIAAQGPFPMYRTILPNDRGEDVEAVQQLLARLGFLRSKPDGVYGRSTREAFTAFMAERGVDVVNGLSRDERTRGPIVPKGELVFLSHLPAIVASVDASVGDRVGEGLIRIEAAPAELGFDTTAAMAALLAIGQTVSLSDTQTGFEAETTVREIDRRAPSTYRVLLETPEELTAEDIGRSLRAIVRLHESEAELNIPLAAVQTTADGSTSVLVVAGGAVSERSVALGRVAAGRAVIESGLEEGDRVVVGWYEP